jgi:sugar O-acyltransferase (sialic acid O-acetyltransferase NeuD family)
MRLYGIYGASGCGRGILPVARSQLAGMFPGEAYELVFIDDRPAAREVNGHPVMTYSEFLERPAETRMVNVAIADSRVREMLVHRCESDGIGFFSAVAENAVRMDDVSVGEGAAISPFVAITSNVRIGRHFQANLYSYVEHDCVIGDFVTFAPRVCCNGNIVIEDLAYIGAGAVLRQGVPGKPLVVGRGAIVGMGAVVTKDVPPGTTVVGNPAKPLIKA